MLNNSEVAQFVKSEISAADGNDTSETNQNRADAINYFLNRPRGDEQEGRSQVQASDVSDMIEALMAQMTPTLTKETLIRFEPAGEEDENAATEETEFCRHLIGAASENYLEVTSAVKDALMLKLGWIRVDVDVEEYTEHVTRTGIAEFQIQKQIEESDNESTWEVADDGVTQNADGVTWDVNFDHFIHKRSLKIESIAPENMVWSQDHTRQDLDGLRFLAEKKFMTRSELRKMGYSKKVVNNLLATTEDMSSAGIARRSNNTTNYNAADKSQEYIETYEVHAWLDVKENGIAQLWHIHYAESEILMKEEVDWIPYAVGCPFPLPHRLDGQSVFDKLKQNQDMGTGLYRLYMDNAALMNRPRIVYNPKVTEEDDVLNARPGGGIRSKVPGDVQQLQTSDMGGSLIQAMQWLDTKRTERAGASLDLGAAQMQLAGNNIGNAGAERQISLKEMLASYMTANLANTLFKNMFLLVHRTAREYMPGQLTAKVAGKWMATDASKWQERRKVIVATGLSMTEKAQKVAALTQLIGVQQQIIATEDGVLVDRPGIYNAMLDWCRASNLSNPEQYFIDPESEEAQQAQQQKAQQQQQMQQMQQQMQEQQNNIFHLQQALEKYKHDSELKFKYDDAALGAEVEEAKIVGQATLDLNREQSRFSREAEQQKESIGGNDGATAAG